MLLNERGRGTIVRRKAHRKKAESKFDFPKELFSSLVPPRNDYEEEGNAINIQMSKRMFGF